MRALFAIAVVILSLPVLADTIPVTNQPVKLCDPATAKCANLTNVGGQQAIKVDVVQTVGGGGGGGTVTANQGTAGVNPWPVSMSSAPLPSGAATESTLAGIKAGTDKIPTSPSQEHTTAVSYHACRVTNGATFLDPTTPSDTQPISAASLPLPAGAATSANQTNGSQVTQLVGGATAKVVAGSTAPLGSDTALVVQTRDTVTVGGSVNATLQSGSNTVGKVDQGTGGSSAWKVDGSATTQPVSGTFWQSTQPVSAASLPLPSGASQEHTTAASPNSTRLSDGAAFYDAAKTGQLPSALDGSGYLKTHEQGTATVSGTVAATQSGTWTVQPGNTANTTAWKVDGSAVTQPVSGTVTANIGTSGSLALDATLTGGTTKAIVRGGAKGSTSATDVTSTATDTNHQALDVNVNNTVPVTGTFWQATQPVSGTVTANQGGSWTNACTESGTWTVQPGNTANTTAWKVDGSAVTQPVSGTVAATQSGTWTVQPGNTANTTAWKVDGSAVTQPVSGTVTASQGGAPWTLQLVDGTTTTQKASVDAGGYLQVAAKALGAYDVTESGTWTVQPGNTANTTPWLARLSDGTNTASVKAADRTADRHTDVAQVVVVRDPVPVYVIQNSAPQNPFLPPCNPVRRYYCNP